MSVKKAGLGYVRKEPATKTSAMGGTRTFTPPHRKPSKLLRTSVFHETDCKPTPNPALADQYLTTVAGFAARFAREAMGCGSVIAEKEYVRVRRLRTALTTAPTLRTSARRGFEPDEDPGGRRRSSRQPVNGSA